VIVTGFRGFREFRFLGRQYDIGRTEVTRTLTRFINWR